MRHREAEADDAWAVLGDRLVDGAYASVKGRIRTYVVHQQLLTHLPPPPAHLLDVGGGAGHQSIPLARLGYAVTILDPSPAMLKRARERLKAESDAVRQRVRTLRARGEDAGSATGGRRFEAVLCHGVLMYLDEPRTMVASLCASAAPGGLVSILALNSQTIAVRPGLEHRWAEALAGFDARNEHGPLGVDTRGDTVEELAAMMRAGQVEPEAWYGVWLFSDWTDVTDVTDAELPALAAVELEASRRDPYRQVSRAFHLVGRRGPD